MPNPGEKGKTAWETHFFFKKGDFVLKAKSLLFFTLPTLRAEGGGPRGYLSGAEGGIQGIHHLGFVHAL